MALQYVALVESVREHGGKVHIFSRMHVSGEQLAQVSFANHLSSFLVCPLASLLLSVTFCCSLTNATQRTYKHAPTNTHLQTRTRADVPRTNEQTNERIHGSSPFHLPCPQVTGVAAMLRFPVDLHDDDDDDDDDDGSGGSGSGHLGGKDAAEGEDEDGAGGGVGYHGSGGGGEEESSDSSGDESYEEDEFGCGYGFLQDAHVDSGESAVVAADGAGAALAPAAASKRVGKRTAAAVVGEGEGDCEEEGSLESLRERENRLAKEASTNFM